MKTLRNVMLINAISSGATGLALAMFPKTIAGTFGTSATMPFIETGIFLTVFAAFVFVVGRSNPVHVRRVRLVIALDTLWVIGSAGIILFQPFAISVIGYVLIGAVAVWVAAMAWLQSAGLRQIQISK